MTPEAGRKRPSRARSTHPRSVTPTPSREAVTMRNRASFYRPEDHPERRYLNVSPAVVGWVAAFVVAAIVVVLALVSGDLSIP